MRVSAARLDLALPVLVALLLIALLGLTGCGDDDGDVDVESFAGTFEVQMSVGDARSDEAADAAALPARGASFIERWVLECDAVSCALHRPEGGVLLGDLDGLVLAVPPAGAGVRVEALTGEVAGVRPEPAVAEPDPCDGTAAETWTVRVEISVNDDVLSGSVIRTPDSLRVAAGEHECFGIDLTLGLSGVRR